MRSIVWITKLKLLKWIPSLKYVRHVVTKMVFMPCSKRKAISPGGFLYVHRVMMCLISGIRYRVQGSGYKVIRLWILDCGLRIFISHPSGILLKEGSKAASHKAGRPTRTRRCFQLCRAKRTQKIIKGSRLTNNGGGVPLAGSDGIYGLPIN